MVSQSILQPLRRWDPERIGPYAIIGKLGAGAMGQVFLARSAAGRLVAVKTIRVELAEEPGFRARFAREVAAARRVSGVFTAAVIEADADADLPWVATAYVPAPSLRTLVRRCGPLPVPAVRWLAAGCAEALQSIHGVGLLHRDVKPSNVLVAPDGPRVIDFGVARAAERVQLTATRGAAGTPQYMAPEQARDATQASPASDVFSLGATIVYAATGHPPYQGETVMDILVRLATEAPDLTGMPGELVALAAACLERVPRDRPTDAAILRELGPLAHPADGGDSYLPASAMALIAEYERGPQRGGQGAAQQRAAAGAPGNGDGGWDYDEDGDSNGGATDGSAAREAAGASDATSGSHTALPGFEPPDAFQASQGPPWPAGTARPGGPAPAGPAARRASRARRRLLAWTGVAVAAIALLAAGTGIGIAVAGPGTPSASQAATPLDVCTSQPSGTGPHVCVSQPYGDSDTVYVIHGTGFRPFTPVTVRLAGVGVSRYRPDTDMRGSFSYAIDQGHYFFRGEMPPGTYTAVVTAGGAPSLSASFTVHPPNPGPPPPGPGQPPPSGQPPPGAGQPPPGSPPPSGQPPP